MTDTCPHGHTRPLNSCHECIRDARDAFTRPKPLVGVAKRDAYAPATRDAWDLVGMALDAATEAVRDMSDDMVSAVVARQTAVAILQAILSIDATPAAELLQARLDDAG